MSIWLTYLVSAAGASLMGSLILWLLIGIHPNSTAGFTFSLYISMLILSSIVITSSCYIILILLKSLGFSLEQVPVKYTIFVTSLVGCLLYFSINFVIISLSSDDGNLKQFFSSWGFIFPLVVGAIYGCAFGIFYSKIRNCAGIY